MSKPGRRVAILGAGVSGLASIKSCLEEGLEPICFEQRREIGGMWSGVDESLTGCAPQPYKSLVTNSSKEMTCFSDYPFPKEVPTYMPMKLVRKYLNSYAEHFNLKPYIQLETKIIQVSKARDYDESGKWDIAIEDSNGRRHTEIVHAVIVCTGVCVKPRYPTIEGMVCFKGKIEHSISFTGGEAYKDRNIVVVGNSFSAGDIAVAVCDHANEVHLSVGNGCHVLRRFDEKGRPTDTQLLKRVYKSKWMAPFYEGVRWRISNMTLNHKRVGILPKTPSSSIGTYMLNDEITLKIMSGKVKVVDRVVSLGENEARLEGGREIQDVDVLIFATGYERDFPFLDKEIVEPTETSDEGKLNWYKMVFPVELPHHTLAMVGFVSSDGSHTPLYELQSRLAARVIAGNHKLPAKETMMADIDKWNSFLKTKYSFYKYQVPYVQFQDEIAAEIGVKPNFWELLWKNPRLAFLCQFDTAFPFQFRLAGPHKNERAIEWCYEARENTFSGIQHRIVPLTSSGFALPIDMNILRLVLVGTLAVCLYTLA
ncbi:dimethylaniline monooxygenase [N-oxide-forming] 1-like [Gigantopelta aegis]|uniref:dimethylaniline monooxygenase [N-oxide-forming] 1-like n=1 Tax=Gigantopelta aegis TaxID=1735272 RepID=UPI001B88B62D|nr:dimethylaniline monooxygenase [N-oxide-forming] 1-like [Gigantopelta aegis]